MEKLIYEIRPYAFAALSVFLLIDSDYGSKLMHVSAFLLLTMALYILKSRWINRRAIS